MRKLSRRELVIGAGSALLAPSVMTVGCGGAGSAIAEAFGRAIVPILFPGYEVAGALSVLSAVLTIFGAGAAGADLTQVVNAIENAEQTLQGIFGSVTAGAFDLLIELFNGSNGGGTMVSRAAVLLTVTNGQTATSPTVVTTGQLQSISILPNQTEPINQQVSLLVSILTASGNLLAVDPSTLTFATTGKSTGMTVSGSGTGHIVATAPTSGTVTVSLGGVTSAAQTVKFS